MPAFNIEDVISDEDLDEAEGYVVGAGGSILSDPNPPTVVHHPYANVSVNPVPAKSVTPSTTTPRVNPRTGRPFVPSPPVGTPRTSNLPYDSNTGLPNPQFNPALPVTTGPASTPVLDPYTGQYVTPGASGAYDPYTGQPLASATGYGAGQTPFDPYTGMPTGYGSSQYGGYGSSYGSAAPDWMNTPPAWYNQSPQQYAQAEQDYYSPVSDEMYDQGDTGLVDDTSEALAGEADILGCEGGLAIEDLG